MGSLEGKEQSHDAVFFFSHQCEFVADKSLVHGQLEGWQRHSLPKALVEDLSHGYALLNSSQHLLSGNQLPGNFGRSEILGRKRSSYLQSLSLRNFELFHPVKRKEKIPSLDLCFY